MTTNFMGWLTHSRGSSSARTTAAEQLRRPNPLPRRTGRGTVPRRAGIQAGIAADFVTRLDAHAPRILSTKGILGTQVFDAGGAPAGHISDLSIDKATGRIVYALVGVDGGLGFLKRLYPAPWGLLRYDARLGGYVTPAERIDVANGPAMTPEQLQALGAGDDTWRERLAIYNSPYLTLPFI